MVRRLAMGVLLLLFLVRSPSACITPPSPLPNDYYINSSFNFCQGTYDVADFRFIINASNAVIDCNGSTITDLSAGFSARRGMFLLQNQTNVELRNCYFLQQRRSIKDVYIKNVSNVRVTNSVLHGALFFASSYVVTVVNTTNLNFTNTSVRLSFGNTAIAIRDEGSPLNSGNIGIYNTSILLSTRDSTLVSVLLSNNNTVFNNLIIKGVQGPPSGNAGTILAFFATASSLIRDNIVLEDVYIAETGTGIIFNSNAAGGLKLNNAKLNNVTILSCQGIIPSRGFWVTSAVDVVGNLNMTDVRILSCDRGTEFEAPFSGLVDANKVILCNNGVDFTSAGTAINKNGLFCDTSTPAGVCQFPCPQNVLVTSIRPSTPTPSDPIVCSAFVDSLDPLDVEFKFYVNGVYQPALDQTVPGCTPLALCSSAPVGPFPAGTEIFCSARGIDPATGTATSVFYSPVIIVRDLGGGVGGDAPDDVENVFSTLPLSVSQVCENDQAKFTIATIPGTRVNIYNDETGDLVDFVVAGADGLAYFYTNSTITYRFEGVKNYYYNEERVLKARDCLKACESSADCSGDEVCSEGRCVALECGYCQVARYNTCINLECCQPSDCGAGYTCENNQCVALQCSEGEEVQGNQCVPKGKSLEELVEQKVDERLGGLEGDVDRIFGRLNLLEAGMKDVKGSIDLLNIKISKIKVEQPLPLWLILLLALSVALSAYSAYKLYDHLKHRDK